MTDNSPKPDAADLARCAILARQIQALALDASTATAQDDLGTIEALGAALSDRLERLARALEEECAAA